MKIADIQLLELTGQSSDASLTDGQRQAQALDLYAEFGLRDPQPAPRTGPRTIKAIYLQITSDEGMVGVYGPIADTQAFLIARILRPFLLNRDPLAIELLNDQMLRLHRHGRSGMLVTAISVVDCCLWDLKGKALNQPVYRLLGGPTRSSVPAYASMLGFSVEPERAAQTAQRYQQMGYQAQKWFFRYGPVHGPEGQRRNLALARALRQAVGPDYPLMFDAFMGWETDYALAMGRQLAEAHPVWLEEPIAPDHIAGLRRLRSESGVAIATGEHVYTRWQVQELLEQEAVDYIQTDPDWTGGISEQVKICHLCSARDIPVVAHGHALLPPLHIAAAQSPATVPWIEYLVGAQETKQFFHAPIYRPREGQVTVPELPGLGLLLDEQKIQSRRALSF